MLIIQREDAKNLLDLAAAYDAVNEGAKDWSSAKIITRRAMISINLLAEAPVQDGLAATNEWLNNQYVV